MPETKEFINMKMSAKKATEMDTVGIDKPRYPYGLSVSFGKETLEKLKYTSDDFTVGSGIEFSAVAKVESVRKSASDNGRSDQSVSLQITDIKITNMKKEGKRTRKAAMSSNPLPHKY